MKVFKKLQRLAVLACVLLTAVSLASARNHKGDKFYKLGETAQDEKDYDSALDYFDQALATDPKDPEYMMADKRIHGKAAEWHLERGKTLQQQQHLTDALVEFQKAMLADPSSSVAIQQVQITTQMIKEQQRAPGVPVLTPAQRARQEVEKRINSLEGPPVLRPINQTIQSLKMNNQPVHVLYESLGKLAGINVLFDPTGIESQPGKNFNVDLNNVTLQEALNYIALETHSFWKPISRNAIFVTQDSDLKRTEYQDEVVKVFYIQNASSQAEFTEIFNAVRTSSKIQQGISQVQSQNAIIARGSPDAVSLIEKLVHDLDKAKSEVLIDVVVMEVNKTKMRTLGASLLGQGGLTLPFIFNPQNPTTIGNGGSTTTSGTTTSGTTTSGTTTTGTTTTSGTTTSGTTTSGTTTSGTTTTGTTSGGNFITLAQLGHLSSADWATSLPSTVLQALMSDSSSRILQRPQLRCSDGGKATLTIGSKIPYVSGSLNSAVATPGSIPYATTQFQQVDVGVKIELDPVHVNGPDEVSMHIKVELSNENGNVIIGGIAEPIITQRVNEAIVRMRDGEVSLMGGLSDNEDSNTNSGFPGLTNVPLLGYVFGTKTKNKTDDEILIALVPHIVRGPDLTTLAESGILAGTEHVVRVARRADGTFEPVNGPAPAVTQPGPATPQTPIAPFTPTPAPAPAPSPNQNNSPQRPPARQNSSPPANNPPEAVPQTDQPAPEPDTQPPPEQQEPPPQ